MTKEFKVGDFVTFIDLTNPRWVGTKYKIAAHGYFSDTSRKLVLVEYLPNVEKPHDIPYKKGDRLYHYQYQLELTDPQMELF
jgi:hypothetical protein